MQARDDFFSWSHINEITGLDGYLKFAEDMINKYKWKPGAKQAFTRALNVIKRKQNDPKFNLSVVGEFGTGKSTFINALLRSELLVMDSMQGTTVSSTIIEDASDYKLRFEYKSGKPLTEKFSALGELKERLHDASTRPEIAKELAGLYVSLPNPALASGYRVIDTPGTNALERWHEETTISTINDVSDVSIILMDGNKGLPETYRAFIENNLAGMLNRCVFVVSKLDQVRPRERERVLEYIKIKLKQHFELIDPLVLPYYSLDVLGTFISGEDAAPDCDNVEASRATEAKIFALMAKQRAVAQAQKLVALIDDMYTQIETQMHDMSGECQRRLELLSRSRQADLGAFIDAQKRARTDSLMNTLRQREQEIVNSYYEYASRAKHSVLDELDKQGSLDGLKAFTSSQLVPKCEVESKVLVSRAQTLNNDISQWYEAEIREFEREFKGLFKKLEILDAELNSNLIAIPSQVSISAPDMSAVNTFVTNNLSKENWMMGGGAVAGAAIGTALFPGIGTVIGGFIGLFAGAMKSPDVDNVKAEAKRKLSPQLDTHFNGVVHLANEALNEGARNASEALKHAIDRYLSEYNDIVETQIEAETKKRGQEEARLKGIREDLEKITRRKQALDSIGARLSKIA